MSSKKNRKKTVKTYSEEEIKNIFRAYFSLVNSNAAIKLSYEHYTFLEIKEESLNDTFDYAATEIDELEKLIKEVFVVGLSDETLSSVTERVTALRGRIISQVQILTKYIDRFSIYQHVLNRVEYRFGEHDSLDEETVIRKVLNYIFEKDDNMVVNTRLLSVIGELPVRMTKNRLCDLIHDGCKVYNGSEKSSFDAFTDLIREVSGVSHIGHEYEKFDDYMKELDYFNSLSFKEMGEDEYRQVQSRFDAVSDEIVSLNDIYSTLISMVNALYMTCLSYGYCEPLPENNAASIIIKATYSMFNEEESDVWERFLNPAGDSFEEKLDSLIPLFEQTVGVQEANAERSQGLYSAIDSIVIMQEDAVKSAFGEDMEKTSRVIRNVDFVSKLSSASEYMELGDDEVVRVGAKNSEELSEEKLANASYIDSEAAKLCTEIKDKIKDSDRRVGRAIMSAILEKLPVFFREAKEVAEYITDALKYCDDEVEKQASMNMLNMLADE